MKINKFAARFDPKQIRALVEAYKLPLVKRASVETETWLHLASRGYVSWMPGVGYRLTLAGNDVANYLSKESQQTTNEDSTMDPNACLKSIDDAIADCDFQVAMESCSELISWIRHDGFLPTLNGHRVGYDRRQLVTELKGIIALCDK